jgi:diguanylate cyclase
MATLPHDEELSVDLLKVILPLMTRHAAGYFPVSYALWYEYAKGGRTELNQQIDLELQRRPRLTAQLTHALYSRFQIEPTEQALLAARDNLVELIHEMKKTVGAAGADAKGFDAKLTQFQESISNATSMEDLAAPLAAIQIEAQRLAGDFGNLVSAFDRRQSDVDLLTEELHKLRAEAQVDILSGLLNRRGLERELERHHAAARANPGGAGALALIILDIDHFKNINDNYGHPLGDRVIAAVGRAMLECVGDLGIAARQGGEEFAVVLPGKGMEAAKSIAESIRARVSEGRIHRRQGEPPVGAVTISAGIAILRDGEDLASLMERADQMLYRSKRAGRNRVSVDQP